MRDEDPAVAPLMDGIIETALYVDDLPRARRFYVDVIGCAPLLESSRLVALSVASRSVLLLFQRGATEAPLPTAGGVVPGHGASGAQHFAFAIAAGTVDEWERRFAGAGVAIESRVRWERGGESLYVRDPDGHSVELATPGLWAIY
ncbi:MAG TPA: VOC family protein [Gemmatimonadaceae bacterium]|jgi:catechol 2,3-dioxygenase-like lactoylglutathione lyase family enzyme|nr:VOC family protein [Gemmatimonadaceae bacterium]